MGAWDDALEIRALVEKWALWRDAGDWERFATVWAADGWMSATWLQGDAATFIEASRRGFESGVSIIHFLGGHVSDVTGERAIAQTKMHIMQRAALDGAEVDVTCVGRFYDFLRKDEGRWLLVRRQPIYEKDWMIPVDPGQRIDLDPQKLARYPVGYRHLGYLQSAAGFDVKLDMPGLTGPEVEKLYAEGRAWLDGSPRPGNVQH
jgi:hypothetical protein